LLVRISALADAERMTVTQDITVPADWIGEDVETYTVPSPKTAKRLQQRVLRKNFSLRSKILLKFKKKMISLHCFFKF
jgi:hypothetical protein